MGEQRFYPAGPRVGQPIVEYPKVVLDPDGKWHRVVGEDEEKALRATWAPPEPPKPRGRQFQKINPIVVDDE